MRNNDDKGSTSIAENGKFGWSRVLRVATMVSIIGGAFGSLVFMFHAGQRSPNFLLAAFTVWVAAPFALLFWVSRTMKRRSMQVELILFGMTFLVSLGSLAVYGGFVDVKPAGSANAFLFDVVPPVSLVFVAVRMGLAMLLSGKSSHP